MIFPSSRTEFSERTATLGGGCCARAKHRGNSHEAAIPAMNSRRFIRSTRWRLPAALARRRRKHHSDDAALAEPFELGRLLLVALSESYRRARSELRGE